MTLPTAENFSLVRGDDWSTAFRFDQAISGFSEIAFTIRETWAATETDNSSATFAATLTGGEITADGSYTINLSIPRSVTATMTSDQYRYDMQVTTVTDKVFTTQRGVIYMIPDVTR